MRNLDQVAVAFAEHFGSEGEPRAFFAPGRVNLIGDHIDYSGGLVLPMALDRGTVLIARPRADSTIRAVSMDLPGEHQATLGDTVFRPEHEWFSYVLGVLHIMQNYGFQLPHGLDLMLAGDIPNGAGLSSSASVELAAGVAFNAYGEFGLSATELAVIGRRAENDYVGVACGIMDQLAIAEGRRGHALLMDCQSLAVTPVPFPHNELSLLVINSNHRRTLADSAYNERRAAVERAAHTLGTPQLVHATLADLETADLSPDEMRAARHTITEQARVLAAAQALRSGDFDTLGQLMRESHESLRDDFAVTGPQLDALAEVAWEQPDVIGARMTGAGFGGCVVAIVRPGSESRVAAAITQGYSARVGVQPTAMVMNSDDGARALTAELGRLR
jgi:galactokinase